MASIVFAEITRNGIGIDLEHLAELRSDLQQRIDELVESMEAMPEAAGLFRRDRQGNYKMTSSGRPGMDQKGVLQPLLVQIADQQEIDAPITSRGITTARKVWNEFRVDHPFLEAYCQLDETCKLYSFLAKLDSDRIQPRYNVLVKTGRSSSSKPNFQQIPKDARFRSLFVAAPGHQLVTIDFAAIELRTLAAECLHRFGESRLAEVFRAGGDPHGQLAADFLGLDLKTFLHAPTPRNYAAR